jgi:hypothetical protein
VFIVYLWKTEKCLLYARIRGGVEEKKEKEKKEKRRKK